MKSTKLKTKTEKGITLIALIITIVVLMILAAVAINSITNEGILSQAGSTANKYNQAVKNEESYLQDYEDMLTALNGGYKDKNFNVGETVKVGTEEFYVLEDKTTQGKVILLTKENIDTENLVQSSNAKDIAFSATDYWYTEGTTLTYPYDLIETGVPDASHYAARAAYDYGVKLGGKGRLMTYTEIETLLETSSNESMIWEGDVNYWIAAAAAPMGDMPMVSVCWTGVVNAVPLEDGGSGVRPVIEISKSKVTKVQ